MSWPPRRPRAVAFAAALGLFVVGLAAILLTGASAAYLGTLLVGCTALGTVLATSLDRRRGAQAAKR